MFEKTYPDPKQENLHITDLKTIKTHPYPGSNSILGITDIWSKLKE
jgi:hypothetical protein